MVGIRLRFAALVLVGVLGSFVSCGSARSDACAAGAERCACRADQTCNGALSCVSNVCVNLMGSAGGSQSSAAGASGKSGGATGGVGNGASGSSGAGQAGSETGGRTGASGGTTTSSAGLSEGGATEGGDSATSGAAGTKGGAGGSSGGGCQSLKIAFQPVAPTVFVLVDRSASMFKCLTSAATSCSDASDSAWGALKQGVLQVIQDNQSSVRFGFGAFTGEQGVMCPILNVVGPQLDNYPAIQGVYEPISPPTFKAETPTAAALSSVQTLLTTDTTPGEKYVLLVTDGEPDFCDDGPNLCPDDATVAQLQAMQKAGFNTFLFAPSSASVNDTALQAFANAGAGDPVVGASSVSDIFYTCSGVTGWETLFNSAAKTGIGALASYAAAGANAPVYRPDPTNPTALAQTFSSTIASVKSCVFNVAGAVSIDLTRTADASVSIAGQVQPQNATNGWSMLDATTLELNGSTCALWRNPASQIIAFNFPCDAFIPK